MHTQNIPDPSTPASREALLVDLVDDNGRSVGTCSVAQAHRLPGRMHRAFSVLLFDGAGRVLLQRRAAVKTRFPGRWSNTCCGHPAPGQDVATAAAIRLVEELGLTVATLTEVGVYRYRAVDAVGGQEENEWDHVLVGALPEGVPAPDPTEVADYAWIAPDELRGHIAAEHDRYTPWLSGVLAAAVPAG